MVCCLSRVYVFAMGSANIVRMWTDCTLTGDCDGRCNRATCGRCTSNIHQCRVPTEARPLQPQWFSRFARVTSPHHLHTGWADAGLWDDTVLIFTTDNGCCALLPPFASPTQHTHTHTHTHIYIYIYAYRRTRHIFAASSVWSENTYI